MRFLGPIGYRSSREVRAHFGPGCIWVRRLIGVGAGLVVGGRLDVWGVMAPSQHVGCGAVVWVVSQHGDVLGAGSE